MRTIISILPIFILLINLSGCTSTVRWDEDVVLHDGKILSVQRYVVYGPDEFGRPGRGGLREQSIRFFYAGNRYKWESDEKWPIVYMPEILDINDEEPVIVLPVHRWGPCKEYGFPQEGLAVFSYRNNSWARIDIEKLPSALKVNLLRSTHELQYGRGLFDYKTVNDAIKVDFERYSIGPKQGDSIASISKFYSGMEESCARIRPLPNPQLDSAKQTNSIAEQDAQTINATNGVVSTAAENISLADYAKRKGMWSGSGYLTGSCKGTVNNIEPLREYFDNGGWHLIGFQLILSHGEKIPLQQFNLSKYQAPTLLQSVICENNIIYTIKRENKDHLLIHRFTYSGDLIDALRIVLPDTNKIMLGAGWGDIWDVTVKNDNLPLL